MFSLCRSPIAADIKNLCMVELACLEDQRHMAMGERRSSQQSAMEEQRGLEARERRQEERRVWPKWQGGAARLRGTPAKKGGAKSPAKRRTEARRHTDEERRGPPKH